MMFNDLATRGNKPDMVWVLHINSVSALTAPTKAFERNFVSFTHRTINQTPVWVGKDLKYRFVPNPCHRRGWNVTCNLRRLGFLKNKQNFCSFWLCNLNFLQFENKKVTLQDRIGSGWGLHPLSLKLNKVIKNICLTPYEGWDSSMKLSGVIPGRCLLLPHIWVPKYCLYIFCSTQRFLKVAEILI